MMIRFVSYPDGVHYIELNKPSKDLGLDKEVTGDVVLKCKMDKSFHQIYLDCKIEANAKMVCDRCNDEFNGLLTNSFKITYLFEKVEEVSDDLNIKYISHEIDRINLSKEVTEYCELSLPMKKLCSEDCKGLCPKCGVNLNEKQCECKVEINDSIWEPLKKLKKQ